MCVSISGRRRFALIPERTRYRMLHSLRYRRLLVHAVFVSLRPRFTLQRRQRRPAGTRSAKQGVLCRGKHLEGPLGGRHHPRQVAATCCCGTPRPTWAFFLPLLCALLPSLSSSYPLSRGSTFTIVCVDTINWYSHFCVKARTSCFPF